MTTNNQVERILFSNLIDHARNHSFGLVSVTSKRFSDKENHFRHASMIGKLKKKGYTVYDFTARIEISDGIVREKLLKFIFVIATDSLEKIFREEVNHLACALHADFFYMPSYLEFNCHEELSAPHRIIMTETIKYTNDSFHINHETKNHYPALTAEYEKVIYPVLVLEGNIKPWPLNYERIRSQCGYDARLHWRTMYEEANNLCVKRTARETILMETEFHDGALIGVDASDISAEDTRQREISLRAFLRVHFSTWSWQEIKSSFIRENICDVSEKVPLKLWYVCDIEDSGTLLPALHEIMKKLHIYSFLWISSHGSVDKIYVVDSLPEGLSSKEALAILDARDTRKELVTGCSSLHPEKIPKKVGSFYMGNQFTADRRSECHGCAENQSRFLKDKRLAEMAWRDIEISEESLK